MTLQHSVRTLISVLAVTMLLATPATSSASEATDSARTANVVVISIDGLRPDAIAAYDLATIQGLMDAGSYTLDARTILPSRTLPSHTSMLTGMTPERHGITFNRSLAGEEIVQVPTIFEIARARGHSTAAFYSKAKFRHLDRANSYDHRQAPSFNADNWMVTRTVTDAVQYIRHRRPNLVFVHIGETDYAGHGTGWMSYFYGLAARRADAAVEHVIDAADAAYGEGNYTVIITSDHGGHNRDHGSDAVEDVTIPWIVSGAGVAARTQPVDVETMDTAATVLWLLGIPLPESFDGAPVLASFSVPLEGATAGN